MKSKPCQHPPKRLYSWFVPAKNTKDGKDTLCVCCCQCGAILKGAAK